MSVPTMATTTDPVRPLGRVVDWRFVILVLFNVAVLGWIVWRPGPATLFTSVANIAYTAGPLVAALWGFAALSRRTPGTVSRQATASWVCLSLGILGYVVGQGVWTYEEVVLHRRTPFPSLADVGFCAAYPFLLGAWHIRSATPVATPDVPAAPGDLRAPSLFQSLLPYALTPPAIGLLCFVYAYGGRGMRAWGVYVAFGLLAILVLARQFFVVWENQGLYVRVREAYARLEEGNRSLQLANQRLETLATTDGMTELPNHRLFQERLRSDLVTARRDGTPLSLLLLDVDHFKQYNDTFGHPAGDDVLRTIASLIRSSVGPSDLPARYGGEEFAVVLPRTDVRAALATAERIRAAVAGHAWQRAAVTVSIGVAMAELSAEAGVLIASADRALYVSKAGGRDRVTLDAAAQDVRPAA